MVSGGALAVINLAAFAVNTFVTFVSNTGLWGKTNKEVSEAYPTLVTPQGWAFSIWGLIFLIEGIFTAVQCWPSQRSANYLRKITPWWVAAQLFQCAWSFAFANEVVWLAAVFIIGIWLCLGVIAVYYATKPSFTREERQERQFKTIGGRAVHPFVGDLLWWLVYRLGFSVHFAWVSAASLINIMVLVSGRGADKASFETQFVVAVCIVFFASSQALYFGLTRGQPALPAVIGWALFAIAGKITTADMFPFSKQYSTTISALSKICKVVAIAHLVFAGLIIVRNLWRWTRRQRQSTSTESSATPALYPDFIKLG